ncbi:ROK family transcriptional regulator [Tessaracoccus sp. MC1865]|uniref:ROK family transcriptional regulator n=1 Tax=Tessaracoccus sp. MC1865 TaxID=2760310 RepID=UPI0016013624|nr:ROK family transcriptional regulator [Tessaracoccus sp. MC1865]MBB1483296.1 ROK family transcriptional regulator [Tessaracoccus sp. MC1865]QTO37292.1 ROK family transcriptional regulator [Tessaracoccus sp. MC1865]
MPAVTRRPPGHTPGIANTERIREVNVSRLLDLLHRGGPQTRAALTRQLGLNRSTMGVLVAQLVKLGIATESEPVPNGTGRPSPVVSLDPGLVAIAINPEVGMLRVAAVATGGRILERVSLPLDDLPSSRTVAALAAEAANDMLKRHPEWRLLGAGVAVPGQIRLQDGSVSEATHLGWTDEPLSSHAAEALGAPTWAANAAILALRAETTFGAGVNRDDLFYIIGGPSGIGGGAVEDGRLLVGAQGFAGEIGHVAVNPGGKECHCGGRGCLEAEVTAAQLGEALGNPDFTIEELVDEWRSRRDEPGLHELNEELLAHLAVALRNIVNLFNPGTILIAGFLAGLVAGRTVEELVPEAIRSSRRDLTILPANVPDAVLLGAAELVFSEFILAPSALT